MKARKQRRTADDLAREASESKTSREALRFGFGHANRAMELDSPGSPIPFVCSTEDVDRYDSVISADGYQLQNFVRNPIMSWCHDTHQPPIGKWQGVHTEGNSLVGEAVFTPADLYPFGAMVESMYRSRFLSAVSVSFIPLDWEIDKTRDGDSDSFMPSINYLTQELTEIAGVVVPGNAQALASGRSAPFLAAKAAGIDTAPMVRYLDQHLDELRGPGVWIPRDEAQRLARALGPQKHISLPGVPAPERTMSSTRTKLRMVLELNTSDLERVKGELEKKARNLGAAVTVSREEISPPHTDTDPDLDGESSGADIMREHLREMREICKDLRGVHKDMVGTRDDLHSGADIYRGVHKDMVQVRDDLHSGADIYRDHHEALGGHVAALKTVRDDLASLIPDKAPNAQPVAQDAASKGAPAGQSRGGAAHKLSVAQKGHLDAATSHIAAMNDLHNGSAPAPDATAPSDGDDAPAPSDDQAKEFKAEMERAAELDRAIELERKIRTATTGKM